MATLTKRTKALRFHRTSLQIIRRDQMVWIRGQQIADLVFIPWPRRVRWQTDCGASAVQAQ